MLVLVIINPIRFMAYRSCNQMRQELHLRLAPLVLDGIIFGQLHHGVIGGRVLQNLKILDLCLPTKQDYNMMYYFILQN